MRSARGIPRRAPRRKAPPPRPPGPREEDRIEIAEYIADMTIQLASMAAGARFELLAYFLNMAHAESRAQVEQAAERGNL